MSALSGINKSAAQKAHRKVLVGIYRKAIGYQPMRMKTVHFATSFLLALTGRFRELELLNKASNPKSVEKAPRDPFVTSNLFSLLNEESPSPLSQTFTEQDLMILRNHLNAAYNNDGAALAAGYKPYSTFGFDFSTPSKEYLTNKSKNHGNSGALVWAIMNATDKGRELLQNALDIFNISDLPASALGRPFVATEEHRATAPDLLLAEGFSTHDIQKAAAIMADQTNAMLRLTENLLDLRPAYALRQLMIGIGSWLLLYLLKRASGSDALIVPDYTAGLSPRIRSQACSCYARHLTNFGDVITKLQADGALSLVDEEHGALDALAAAVPTDLEEHLNDIALRLGWVQPRTASVKVKHYETVPDTLRVLITSIISDGEVLVMDQVAERLLKSWRICLGLRPTDHDLLQKKGFSPLDQDADLRLNRECFKRLAIALGLAKEPSDGLVLFTLGTGDAH